MDKVTETYGPKPSPKQVAEMAKYRGITYQKRGKQNQEQTQASALQVPSLPLENIPSNNESNFDVGEWASRVKIPVPLTEVLKMDDQKQKFFQAINVPLPSKVEVPKNNHKNMEKQPVEAYQDALVILQTMDKANKGNDPFYVTLLVNGQLLHNYMLDSGASSCVMSKKVMQQLNLRISRSSQHLCYG